MSFARRALVLGQLHGACGPRGDSVVEDLAQSPPSNGIAQELGPCSPHTGPMAEFRQRVRENQRAWARLRQLRQPA